MTKRQNPLGAPTRYPSTYDPGLLFPIPRSENRQRLGFGADQLPFKGYDLWRAWEVSWLDHRGKPVVAVAEFLVPASSPNMVESKSFKLYLNSLNQKRFSGFEEVQSLLVRDLGLVTGAVVLVQLFCLSAFADLQCSRSEGLCLDDLDIAVESYEPDSALLVSDISRNVEETVHTNLFRSNCPVTSQPDWGTVTISYSGPALLHDALLRYLISYRSHNGFHEDCVEQIYQDLHALAAPEKLTVAINFLRRGGLEINPVRTSSPSSLEFPGPRLLRQ